MTKRRGAAVRGMFAVTVIRYPATVLSLIQKNIDRMFPNSSANADLLLIDLNHTSLRGFAGSSYDGFFKGTTTISGTLTSMLATPLSAALRSSSARRCRGESAQAPRAGLRCIVGEGRSLFRVVVEGSSLASAASRYPIHHIDV
jgi:hypothetical protein